MARTSAACARPCSVWRCCISSCPFVSATPATPVWARHMPMRDPSPMSTTLIIATRCLRCIMIGQHFLLSTLSPQTDAQLLLPRRHPLSLLIRATFLFTLRRETER